MKGWLCRIDQKLAEGIQILTYSPPLGFQGRVTNIVILITPLCLEIKAREPMREKATFRNRMKETSKTRVDTKIQLAASM